MDGESFDHPEVIRRLNRDFIPVRVDSDKRPDVNSRYNMGGWPTVAVLDSEGRVIVGDTYLPTGRLLEMLSQVRKGLEEAPARPILSHPEEDGLRHGAPPNESLPAVLEAITASLSRAFDPEYGGFGGPPKFPQPWAIEWLFHLHQRTKDPKWFEMAKRTLDNMRDSPLYDPIDGGFFRYSTRGDWDRPHYEKLLELNARMLMIYLRAYQQSGDASYRYTAYGILDYLYTSLAVEDDGWFCGSQSSDEEYYALTQEDRAGIASPQRDRTLYTDQNATTVSALLLAGQVLEDPDYHTSALSLINLLLGRCRHFELGMYHCIDGQPSLPGYLSDQTQMINALADAFEATGEIRYLDHAKELVEIINRHLWDEKKGGYWDLPENSRSEGILKLRMKPLNENAAGAIGLNRLFQLTGEMDHYRRSQSILEFLSTVYRPYKHHAAPFALAVERSINPPLSVAIVGRTSHPEWKTWVTTAHRIKVPWKVILPLDAEKSKDRIRALGFPISTVPTAYVCIGSKCLPPILTPEALIEVSSS
jgi:uncharacterized protein